MQLGIEATTTGKFSSDIAIDNIRIEPGPCQSKNIIVLHHIQTVLLILKCIYIKVYLNIYKAVNKSMLMYVN